MLLLQSFGVFAGSWTLVDLVSVARTLLVPLVSTMRAAVSAQEVAYQSTSFLFRGPALWSQLWWIVAPLSLLAAPLVRYACTPPAPHLRRLLPWQRTVNPHLPSGAEADSALAAQRLCLFEPASSAHPALLRGTPPGLDAREVDSGFGFGWVA